MELNCPSCDNGIGSDGNSCKVCGGDSVIGLVDAEFGLHTINPKVYGIVWNELLTQLTDLTDKVNDVMDKCEDIKEVVDEL